MKITYKSAGDQSILIQVGDNSISEEVNARVRSLAEMVEKNPNLGFGEVILSYCSLLVHYDPLKLSFDEAVAKFKEQEHQLKDIGDSEARLIEIPTVYGDEWGPDLEDVAAYTHLSTSEVIAIHSSVNYLVYFLGFTPGYPFLGGMSEKIVIPRLSSPRISIPAGSVAIANQQAGIYPIDSPGGWRLIGRTPLRFYDPHGENPFLLKSGDYVCFKQIDSSQYKEIQSQVNARTYTPVIRPYSKEPSNDHI